MSSGKVYERLFDFFAEIHEKGIKKGKMINSFGKDQGNYFYRSIVDIMPTVPNLLMKHRLAIRTVKVDLKYIENTTPKIDYKGNQTFLASHIVTAEYVIYTDDGSETESFVGIGQADGKDPKHKGCSAAFTNALKSFILTNLAGLPNGDNDEEDDSIETVEDKKISSILEIDAIRLAFIHEAKKTCKNYEQAKELWINNFYPKTTDMEKPENWTQLIQSIIDSFPKSGERKA